MPRLTPQQASERLASGIRNGSTNYIAGVEAVTKNPAESAIEARGKWVNAMTNPATHDKWQRGLERTSITDWKQATAGVGAQRFSQSADKAQTNYEAFARDFFPYLATVENTISQMPNVTIDERINRAVENMRLLSQYTRSS